MNSLNRFYLPGIVLLTIAAGAPAQPPSYSKQVKPFFARYCLECHSADKTKGDLNLETYQGLRAGGKSGPVVVPGKPDESRLVRLAEGKDKPAMPPKKAKQPKPNEVAILRAWVAAGAKEDKAAPVVTIPNIKPRVPVTAPIAAVAYHPGGKVLAAGGYQEVILLDVATSDVVGKLTGQRGEVTALAFSRDGRWLAVAGFVAGTAGEVRLYAVAATGIPGEKPVHILAAHQDAVLNMAWSPDSKVLATAGYDRLIKLWDAATGRELRTLKDHSDAVYGLAFSPDGRWLGSGGADRAVKVWEVASGKRLYTLGESTDWVYAVAWSPDGKHLSAAGVDRSIRVWEISPEGGKIVHSVFAHASPVTRLAYAADGKTLYSLSEDRSLKAWDTGRMTERKVYTRQPEVALALALRPDQRQLALGRYDGRLVLLDAATGKVQAEPLPPKPKPPQLTKLDLPAGRRGQVLRLTFEGKHLDGITALSTPTPGVTGKVVSATKTRAQLDVTFSAQLAAGTYQLGLKGPAGETAKLPFALDLFAAVPEQEPNDSPVTGQKIQLPATVTGAVDRGGDVDYYRFEARAGQQLGVQALTPPGSKLEPVLRLTNASGTVLAESTNGLLGFTIPRAGIYALGIHDREYRGDPKMTYRLQVGDIPIVTGIFPLGLQRGTEADVVLDGVNLGTTRSVRVKVPADAKPGSRVPVPITTSHGAVLGSPSVTVGEFPEVAHGSDPATVPVPGTANGRIDQPGATETWRFTAKKGQRLILEVNARRLGSALDSVIEVLDHDGRPVPRAVLRCLAKTYTTFRDHDAAGSGIRIETWSELAVNDYMLVGDELVRIRALPRNPDDDCQFFSVRGQRVGFLDTTPTHHSLGTPMYKVAIHPPGTVLAPNGLPVVTLYYRNDDGGPGYGKDSRLFFDPPADGEYQVRIGDSRGQGGRHFAYRLTIRPPRPSFNISFDPASPTVWKGGAVPITVRADRLDGFEGAIGVHLDNLPAGFSAPPTSIPEGDNSTAFALWADATAKNPAKVPPLKLTARAVIDGREVVREFTGGVPKVKEPGDLVTTTRQAEVTVHPGGQVTVTATIERRNGFKGRVPLEVVGLPHGVRVLDVGLNGILITEKETTRTFVIYAEPWVKPMAHPFVVLARREGKNTRHAAKSVLLRIAGPDAAPSEESRRGGSR